MRTCARILGLLAAVTVAACDTTPPPTAPDAPTAKAVPAPLAIEAGTFFAVDVLPFPADATAATAINDAGQIAGPTGNGTAGAYFYDAATGYSAIPFNSTSPTLWPVSLSSNGIVSATEGCPDTSCELRPFRWTSATGLVPITTGHYRGTSLGVNASGSVVGEIAPRFLNESKATRWTAADALQVLPPPPFDASGLYSRAFDVNDAGAVVFSVEGTPFVWTEGGGAVRLTGLEAAVAAVETGTLRGITPSQINGVGDIAGWWSIEGGPARRGFFYAADGTFQHFDLAADVVPTDLNDHGEVVIYTADDASSPTSRRPWLWSQALGYVELPTLDPDDTVAGGINNLGFIVGSSGGRPILWRPLTSAGEVLDELEETLEDVLEGGDVDVEGGNGLEAKLAGIRDHMEAGRANAARNQLAAFVNQVEAMIADGRLSPDDGAALLAAAASLAELLA